MEAKFVAMDTENTPSGSLGTWSIAFRNSENALCVCSAFGTEKKQELAQVFQRAVTVFHNYKWDKRVLQANKMPIPNNYVDTMIAAYCLGLGRQDVKQSDVTTDTGVIGGLGLKYLARRHLGFEMNTWQDVKDHPELMQEYNAKDSVATYLLWEKWLPILPNHFWTIDMPLLPVIMAMEGRGIAIDPNKLGELGEHLARAMKDIDLPLNPFSNQEIQSYVYGELGVVPFKFTDTGQPSVDEDVLETIDDAGVRKILEYKSLYKEKDTYIDNYVQRMTLDGRVHPEFKQCRTSTGRLSSARPNLQNVPKTEMRTLFIAPPGKKLVRVDWKQLELIVSAVLAPEPVLIEKYKRLMAGEDVDVHQEQADELNIKRDFAKHLNFMLQNSGSIKDCAWKVSFELHMPIDEATAYVKSYYTKYQGLYTAKQEIIGQANDTKKVTNYMGRTLRVDALYAEDWRVIKQGERQAICFPIQSLAAEIVKLVMIDLHNKHNAPLLLQVHDELIFEVDEKDATEYAHWLKEYIPSLVTINGVSFPVSVSVGNNWWETMQKEE